MKTKVNIVSAILVISSLVLKAQENNYKDHIWSFEGKKHTHTIGSYLSLSGSYSPLKNDDAYWLGGRIGVVFDKRWSIGVGGNVLDYDKHLDQLVNDGTYRLEAGYAGLFLEHIVPLKDWGKISFSNLSGLGITSLKYDKEYAESRPWYEETIDTENFSSNEFGLELQIRVYENWWLGAHANYRLTSPIELEGEDDFFLRDYSAGISITWGIF